MSEVHDERRRRLLWRASHRGTKEMDILLGRFAAARIGGMNDEALSELETIIALPDHELFSWIAGQSPIPVELRNATLDALIAFRP